MNKPENNQAKYYFDEDVNFILENYNNAKPFSSFFPGIAGENGIPIWVFYTNRGQLISGMGTQDKDHSIMEFLPANWAYSLVSKQGFRTFLKFKNLKDQKFYEPFQNHYSNQKYNINQKMIISSSKLILEEINYTLNLKFNVEYFTVPCDCYGGLIRTLKVYNLGNETVEFSVLDGLPLIVPFGVDNFCLKNMRRTIEAFVVVSNLENRAPVFKGKVEPTDSPKVLKIKRGNFYLGFEDNNSRLELVDPIVDPAKVFGNQSDFDYPLNFINAPKDELFKDQVTENKLPCTFGYSDVRISKDEQYRYTSIIGNISSVKSLNKMIPKIVNRDYISSKDRTNNEILKSITQNNLISSGVKTFDKYAEQNFLDNIMRGGFPKIFKGDEKNSVLYIYSRKHGDMERDYNYFSLLPTPYSQGNGNFRDINQNRRSDLFFNPDIEEENIVHFYNLIQLDGYNPLVLKESIFNIKSKVELNHILEQYFEDGEDKILSENLQESFTPGKLYLFLNENFEIVEDKKIELIRKIINISTKVPTADYGESYWIDHWTYNLDLLENYQAIYPEKLIDLLFNKKIFMFYDNPNCVQPRINKYVLWEGQPFQLNSVYKNEEKEKIIDSRDEFKNYVRVDNGNGSIYYTSLFTKLLSIILNKVSSLDFDGIGVEMEADKPGWYDALNGLPGLFGSSVCESIEIKRHALFILKVLNSSSINFDEILIFDELYDFLDLTTDILNDNLTSYQYWDSSHSLREEYLDKTKFGLKGTQKTIKLDKVKTFLKAVIDKIDEGISKAWDSKSNVLYTYFRYEITNYNFINEKHSGMDPKSLVNLDELINIKPVEYKRVPLPLFLEAAVHYLRCSPERSQADELVRNIKKSNLYDKKLKMYKINEALENEPMEIGRARVFTPGWLENESIWLHMEYKYMLELIRNNLFDEFYSNFKNVFIPFLEPESYGRSTLENSSFLVSSSHFDKSIHGNGFVARLSGATAEFIHILHLMTIGQNPFSLNDAGELEFSLKPSLPNWLFTKTPRVLSIYNNQIKDKIDIPENSFSFMFLGKILVTYHNKKLKNTFGENSVKPIEYKITTNSGDVISIMSEIITGKAVHSIRDRKVSRIDVILN